MKKPAALALAFLLAAPAAAQGDAPSPEKLDLARRVVNAIGTQYEVEKNDLLTFGLFRPFGEKGALYRAALERVLTAHKNDIEKANAERVRIFARNYTDEDLRVWIAYLESPRGKSIRAKQAAAAAASLAHSQISPSLTAQLTPDEQAARQGFEQGRQKIMASRSAKASAEALAVTRRLSLTLIDAVTLDFCTHGGACPAQLLETAKAKTRKP